MHYGVFLYLQWFSTCMTNWSCVYELYSIWEKETHKSSAFKMLWYKTTFTQGYTMFTNYKKYKPLICLSELSDHLDPVIKHFYPIYRAQLVFEWYESKALAFAGFLTQHNRFWNGKLDSTLNRCRQDKNRGNIRSSRRVSNNQCQSILKLFWHHVVTASKGLILLLKNILLLMIHECCF